MMTNDKIRALIAEAEQHVEIVRCGNPGHTNVAVGCPDCGTFCEWCDDEWPCLPRRLADALSALKLHDEIAALTAAGDAPQADAKPVDTAAEHAKSRADSSHVAPQEPSPVASTPTVSDDSGHCGDDDRGGREDGPEDEGRSHQATVAGTPQRPSGCAECHRSEGHKMDCSHRLAPSPDREKLIAVRLYCENQGDKFRHHAGRILEMIGSADALAAQPVPDDVIERAERVVTRHLSRLSKRDDWGEDDTAIGGQGAFIVRVLAEEGLLAAQPMLNPEKVAEMIRDELRKGEYASAPDELPYAATSRHVARALCEAAKRGELT